jgi:hypothetical protein
MLSQEKNNRFEDGSRASDACREGRGRGEQTACQLYACRGVKVVEEVGDPLEWCLTLWLGRRRVGVFGLGWLAEYHRRRGTTGFGLAHWWRRPPRGLPNRARWTEGGFLRGFSLNDAATSNHVVPAWAKFLLFGRKTNWCRFGCRQA